LLLEGIEIDLEGSGNQELRSSDTATTCLRSQRAKGGNRQCIVISYVGKHSSGKTKQPLVQVTHRRSFLCRNARFLGARARDFLRGLSGADLDRGPRPFSWNG
jgi:hypothetical protein